jgi:hypothetical protein
MTADIIPHDFGRRIAPEEVPGDFPACLEREKWRGGEPCEHRRGPFSLLEAEGMAQCACGEKVTLLHVFKLLATGENQLRQRFEYQRQLIAEMENRTRYKCEHCGKMNSLKPK